MEKNGMERILNTDAQKCVTNSQSQRAIEETFKRLEGSLYPADARLFRSTTLKDVQEAARIVQRDQEERKCIRNLRRIKPLFATLERLGGAVDTLCQGCKVSPILLI